MRWKAFTKCLREGCDGDIEFWLEELVETPTGNVKPRYRFCCTECDLQGPWELYARQRKYHGDKRGAGFGRTQEAFEHSPEDF